MMTATLAPLLIGSTARMRRVMTYWAATAFIYSLCAAVVLREGSLEQARRPGAWLEAAVVAGIGFAAVSVFYMVLRASERLRIAQWRLALGQAYFAVVYDMLLYAVLGDLRGAILIGLPVVIVFCAFALRPAQTIGLSIFAVAALAVTSSLLAWLRPAQHPLNIELMHVILASFGVVSVAAINSELSRLRARLIDAVATIRRLATTDELTHLANRRHMHELLEAEQQHRHAAPGHVCVALLDIDHFKGINDRYGHAAGDAVLQAFAGAAMAALRSGDTLARWGGEEFLLLMPDTELPDALSALARIGAAVAALRFAGIDAELRLTFSAGVAAATLPGSRFDEAIARADAAMYQAKASGRNCVVAAPASA
jgi:diguanylate cyclase (GGDEF)-like protein